jgi:hypothetical protein
MISDNISAFLFAFQYTGIRLRAESRQAMDTSSHAENAAYPQAVHGSLDDKTTADTAER